MPEPEAARRYSRPDEAAERCGGVRALPMLQELMRRGQPERLRQRGAARQLRVLVMAARLLRLGGRAEQP